ncbi:MAG: ribokinase [Tepidisphaeraceae bacterium]
MPRRPFIVVIGSINTDLILPIPRLPLPGETLSGDDAQVVHGGKGANQAVAAARLGADVAMVGRVGQDDFGDRMRAGLEAEGINVRHVRRTPGSSGTAMILLQAGGENSIILSPGANAKVTPDDVQAALPLIRRADAVLLQLEIPLKTVHAAMRAAKEAGVPIVLDPAPAPVGRVPKWLTKVDVLSPNESEAALLLGKPGKRPQQTAAALIQAGAKNVILKLGAAGSLHADGTGVLTESAGFKVKVVDTTAAGDAFTAALAVARANGLSWAETLRFANATGALACTKLGAQPSLPKRRDVQRIL